MSLLFPPLYDDYLLFIYYVFTYTFLFTLISFIYLSASVTKPKSSIFTSKEIPSMKSK